MAPTLFVPLALNFLLIGALPLVFFRRDGRLNVRWWLTATPLFVAGATVAAGLFGLIDVWTLPPDLADGAAIVAAELSIGSVALVCYTLGTHRRRIALWHQDDDAPAEIVTDGPYRHVRHPFYTAFVAALAAAALALPSPITAGCLAWGVVALSLTARREEARLLDSVFGAEYRLYMRRTGRLLPLIG